MSTVALPLLPDVERLASRWLRERPEVAALIGDRVFTAYPANAGGAPLVLLTRVGGIPPFSQPLVFDQGQLQVACYGGTKAMAHDLAATCQRELSLLEGQLRPEGAVAAVRFGSKQYLPDEAFEPPRPRYLFDVTVHVKALGGSPAARGTTGRRGPPAEPASLKGG